MQKIFPLLFFICINTISAGLSDPFYLNDQNRSSIERVGDFFQIALPLGALGLAKAYKDRDGKKQFWKSYLSSVGTTYLLKVVVDKERPNGHCCESFPSGHTTAAFSGAMFIQKRYGSNYGFPSLLLASFVGYSRVYAKKHYWIDVICGATIGVLGNIFFTNKKNPVEALFFQDSKGDYRLNLIYSL